MTKNFIKYEQNFMKNLIIKRGCEHTHTVKMIFI